MTNMTIDVVSKYTLSVILTLPICPRNLPLRQAAMPYVDPSKSKLLNLEMFSLVPVVPNRQLPRYHYHGAHQAAP